MIYCIFVVVGSGFKIKLIEQVDQSDAIFSILFTPLKCSMTIENKIKFRKNEKI